MGARLSSKGITCTHPSTPYTTAGWALASSHLTDETGEASSSEEAESGVCRAWQDCNGRQGWDKRGSRFALALLKLCVLDQVT